MLAQTHDYPVRAGFKDGSTSREAARIIDQDSTTPEKYARIIVALFDDPCMTCDEIAAVTGFTQFYTRPRLSALKDFGVIRRVARSRRTKSGRNAWTMTLHEDFYTLLSESPESDRLFIAQAIYEEARASYEASTIEQALASGLVS